MNNRLIGVVSALLSVIIVGFCGASFLGILTLHATSSVIVGLFALEMALMGLDLLLQSRKIASVIAFIPAGMGLVFACMLFF